MPSNHGVELNDHLLVSASKEDHEMQQMKIVASLSRRHMVGSILSGVTARYETQSSSAIGRPSGVDRSSRGRENPNDFGAARF